MKVYPIHQNLNTSFVDLSSLVKHLYSLQFVGRVHLELSAYEADIVFRPRNQVHAREYDHLAGCLKDGEVALRNILVRAQEPNGRIHVFSEEVSPQARTLVNRVFVDEAIVSGARKMAFGFCDTNASSGLPEADILDIALINRDREEFKELVLEILKNASVAFEKQGLDFELLFYKACKVNSDRFPFLAPEASGLEFNEGRLYVAENVSADQLADALSALLGHILLRLRQSRENSLLFDQTTYRMRTVLARRSRLLDRMALRRRFEELVDDQTN